MGKKSSIIFPVFFSFFFLLSSLKNSFAHNVSDSQKEMIYQGGIGEYFNLGFVHMLTGYDHLLFLLGVVFFLQSFLDIVKFITAFTLGHTITLLGATYLGINANYYLVDAVIAFSVMYKGFENLKGFRWVGLNPPNLMIMVFLFGLIHGFGLSTRLQQLVLPEQGLLLKILSFNAGVELGQVAGLAVIFLVLIFLKKTLIFYSLARLINGLIFIAGFLLLIFQLHGYIHHQYPEEFHHHEPEPPAHQNVNYHDELEPLNKEE